MSIRAQNLYQFDKFIIVNGILRIFLIVSSVVQTRRGSLITRVRRCRVADRDTQEYSVNRRARPYGIEMISTTYAESKIYFGAHFAHNGLRNGLRFLTIQLARGMTKNSDLVDTLLVITSQHLEVIHTR